MWQIDLNDKNNGVELLVTMYSKGCNSYLLEIFPVLKIELGIKRLSS